MNEVFNITFKKDVSKAININLSERGVREEIYISQ